VDGYDISMYAPYWINSAGTSGQVWTSDGSGRGNWSSQPAVTGSGTTNYISKWTSSSALGNSIIYDDGFHVGIGTTNPTGALQVAGFADSSPSIKSTTIGTSGDYAAIELKGTSSGTGGGYIDFGYPNNDYAARIIYYNSSNSLKFVNPTGKIEVDANGFGPIYMSYKSLYDDYGVFVPYNSNYTFGVIGEGGATGVSGYGQHGVEGTTSLSSGAGIGGLFTGGSSGYGVEASGGAYDFYANGSGTDYGPFTGGHDVIIEKDIADSLKPGFIVSVTGETEKRLQEDGSVSLSSTLPHIQLSSAEKDSSILGVFVSTSSNSDFWYSLKDNEERGIVNALGEGRVWVTDINGEIKAGDYITTSYIPGYGQKQNDDVVHSYTLGKATETPDWSTSQTIIYNGKTYHKYLIGVVYTSG